MTVYVNMVSYLSSQAAFLLIFGKGLDELLSKHIAHLFIRDPLVVFSETIHQDDSTSNDHFEVRICSFRPYEFFLMTCDNTVEHSIHKLADTALQAAPSGFIHRLAR